MEIHRDFDEHQVVEECVQYDNKEYGTNVNVEKIKHPSLGFPKVLKRHGSGKEIHFDHSINKETETRNFECNPKTASNDCFDFNFTVSDLLKLRWTNPIGEDESDFSSTKKADGNLHSIRFNFDGIICDNRNVDEKSNKDDLYYYRGLHHHSEQGDCEGYTIPELIHLSRSSNVSQRCISIRTLGNIFLKIRQYIIIEHENSRVYNKHLLGYLFGIHRWYRYLTEDLSIHYLLLNMLFHNSFISRTAECSVISLCNMFCGSFYSHHYNYLLSYEKDSERIKFSVLFLFFSPSEFVFEMMNDMVNHYPYCYRNSIIYQNIEFIQEFNKDNTIYNDLESDKHLINFELPDGKKVELLRDILQEVYQFKPIKYDYEIESKRNSLIHFLLKISQNKNMSIDSRISSIRLILLFIMRGGCINDNKICFADLNEMLNLVGDELFDFSSMLLGFDESKENNRIADLLLSYLVFLRVYIQVIYNIDGNKINDIDLKKSELSNLLINSTLQIIRSVILFVLNPNNNKSKDNIQSSVELSLVEGLRIIGLMYINNIYIEDLSIYCKYLVHFLTLFEPNSSLNAYLVYHFYMLGYYLNLHNSENNYILQEHLLFVQVLCQFTSKLHKKFMIILKSENSNSLFNFLLISISNLRFLNAVKNRNADIYRFNDEVLEIFFDYHKFIKQFLLEVKLNEFNSRIITIESGSLLGTELGSISFGDLLNNNDYYFRYYSIAIISTYLKEISNYLLLYCKVNCNYKGSIIEIINSFYVELLLNFYSKQLYDCIYIKYKKDLECEDLTKLNNIQSYNYEYSYFETLFIYDNQPLVYNNKITKNSELIQLLCSNNIRILVLSMFGDKLTNNFILNSRGSQFCTNKKENHTELDSSFQIFKISSLDFTFRFDEIKNHLFAMLLSCKDIREYSIIAYWLLNGENKDYGTFEHFYSLIVNEYSKYIDLDSDTLTFNLFIYTVNILFKTENILENASSKLLFELFKDIFSISFVNDAKVYASKYLFEYSVNQLLCFSRSDPSSSTRFIGGFILKFLKLSLELHNCDSNEDRELESILSNLNSKESLFTVQYSYINNLYDLNHYEDNNYIKRLVDTIMVSFSDSNLFFEKTILDCYYLIIVYLLTLLISDSEMQFKLLSNQKILKFLLFHKGDNSVEMLLRNNPNIELTKNQLNEHSITTRKVNDIIYESITIYRNDISRGTLLLLLFIYIYNSKLQKCNNSEKNIDVLLKLLKK